MIELPSGRGDRNLIVVHRPAVPDELAIARNAGADVAFEGLTHRELAHIGQRADATRTREDL